MTAAAGSIQIRFVTSPSWLRAAASCGIQLAPLLDKSGIDMSSTPTPLVTAAQLEQLMEHCVEQCGSRHYFPFAAADAFVFDSMPAISVFVATSPTCRQALPVLEWSGRLLPALHLAIEERGPRAMLVLDAITLSADRRRAGFFTELTIAIFQRFARMMLGDRARAQCIELRHDPGPYRAICEERFGCPILVNRPRDVVVFNRELLDVPLAGGFPQLNDRLRQSIQNELPPSRDQPIGSMVDGVRQLLQGHPPLLGGGLAELAERLGVHSRTLQRRLSEAGTSVAALIAEQREQQARHALAVEDIDIETLSRQLGFVDRHSFTRAFRRWTGETPTRYRRQHRRHSK